MRIIAGEARGRRLFAPPGRDTRPTLDRVRESLFSILQSRLPGATVLDLFAGSGALAFEALSRGAKRAVLVDSDRCAQAAIRRNLEALGYADRATLLPMDWRRALERLSGEFDLIFLDPPYRMPGAQDVLPALAPYLAEGACIAYEHDRALPPSAPGYTVMDFRAYGDTAISFFSKDP